MRSPALSPGAPTNVFDTGERNTHSMVCTYLFDKISKYCEMATCIVFKVYKDETINMHKLTSITHR